MEGGLNDQAFGTELMKNIIISKQADRLAIWQVGKPVGNEAVRLARRQVGCRYAGKEVGRKP